MATVAEVNKMMEAWEEGGTSCPKCGAADGEECAPGCVQGSDQHFEGADHFDKFMDRILNEGRHRRPQVPTANDSLQRLRASRVQERPLGRIRMGVPR